MKDLYQSCLISRLSRFIELTDDERRFIEHLEKEERAHKKGDAIVSLGDATNGIMVLKTGWVVVRADTTDGRSQILRVYLPGEVLGLAELGTSSAHHTMIMQTDGVVCPFPRGGLAPMLADQPRLTALLMSLGSLDQVALRHHAACLGSMDAKAKLKFFLLQLRSRLAVANEGIGERFRVPFNQTEIGQAVGLTSVYVNKLLQSFIAAGELEIERPYFRMLARAAWECDTQFIDPFVDMDTSWFPPLA